MSNAPRPTILPTAGSLRQSTIPGASLQQPSSLQSRINSKRAELENLRQLRDVSGALASQMEELEEKLETLKDGTEGMYIMVNPILSFRFQEGRKGLNVCILIG